MSYWLVKTVFCGASLVGSFLYFNHIEKKTGLAIDNVKLNEIQSINQRLHDIEVTLCKIERFKKYTDFYIGMILLSCVALFFSA